MSRKNRKPRKPFPKQLARINKERNPHRNPPPETEKKFINEFPKIIPVLGVAGFVIFPSSAFPIPMPDDPETKSLVAILKEKPYLVIRPRLQDGRAFPVGILGKVTNLDETDPSHPCFTFKGICRIHVEDLGIQNGFTMAKYKTFVELPIPKTLHKNEDVQMNLFMLQDEFPVNFSIFIQWVLGVEAKLFFDQKFVNDAMIRLQHVDTENIVSVLDGIMNMLNHMPLTIKGKRVDIINPSLSILAEPSILIRLKRVMDFAESIFQYCPLFKNHMCGSAEIFNEESPVSEEGVDISQKSGREVIKEELSRLREIKPRFQPLSREEITGSLVKLDSEKQSALEQNFLAHMGQYIVNQKLLKKRFAQCLIRLHTGLADPERPAILGIICGPTGVGKTESVKALADYLLDDPEAFTRLDCGDYQEPHSHQNIIGSPRGYIGSDKETELTQWQLDQYHVKKELKKRYQNEPEKLKSILEEIELLVEMLKYNPSQPDEAAEYKKTKQKLRQFGWRPGKHIALFLFDETEKAHQNLLKLFLRVLDNGFLKKANGEKIDFRNTIMVFTSNLNGKKIAEMISGHTIGFVGKNHNTIPQTELTKRIYKETLREVQRFLLPEILGRIGKERIIVLHPLREKDLLEILETMTLPKLGSVLREKYQIELHITESAKKFIVRESGQDEINKTLGARALAAVVERKIEESIGNLIELAENGGIVRGDHIMITTEMVEKDGEEKEKICIKKITRSS